MSGEKPRGCLRILMVEDSENDALLIADGLGRAGYEVSWTRVDSAAALRAALEKTDWDVILSDWRLPGFSAVEAFAICHVAGVSAPFLIVSGSHEVEVTPGIRAWVEKDDLGKLARVVARELG